MEGGVNELRIGDGSFFKTARTFFQIPGKDLLQRVLHPESLPLEALLGIQPWIESDTTDLPFGSY